MSLRPTGDGFLTVSVAGPHRAMEFTAAAVTLADPGVQLQGSP
ncbi:hypothetical protein [Streptomyces sp. NPDC086023]